MLIDLAGTNCVHNSLVLTCEFMYNNTSGILWLDSVSIGNTYSMNLYNRLGLMSASFGWIWRHWNHNVELKLRW